MTNSQSRVPKFGKEMSSLMPFTNLIGMMAHSLKSIENILMSPIMEKSNLNRDSN